ncbi:unnamed protein product [Caenorhabditis auriculariae]|uniref:Uncharacterized protein n=1 Tax=Caenorhabditis auriculariae TaxID=2777116 RepID=A0A8S1HVQ5_9PELO|nr:unnamed protein product [Caenorhabditis auriculariae]
MEDTVLEENSDEEKSIRHDPCVGTLKFWNRLMVPVSLLFCFITIILGISDLVKQFDNAFSYLFVYILSVISLFKNSAVSHLCCMIARGNCVINTIMSVAVVCIELSFGVTKFPFITLLILFLFLVFDVWFTFISYKLLRAAPGKS